MAASAVGAETLLPFKMKVFVLRWSSHIGRRSIRRRIGCSSRRSRRGRGVVIFGVFFAGAGKRRQAQQYSADQKNCGNRKFHFHCTLLPCGHIGVTKRYVRPKTQRLVFLSTMNCRPKLAEARTSL